MLTIREARNTDFKVLEGLYEFLLSLELDIIKEVGNDKFLDILKECFLSEKDRFSHKYCKVVEENNNILGFSFSYFYDDVEMAKNYWFNDVVNKYSLPNNSIIFDYDEALEQEFYLDTLYVFSEARGKGIGTLLLKDFSNQNYDVKSLNVAQSNFGAKKLYESFGFVANGEIWIGHENYDHMILKR